jgi:hypothetical protein
MQYNAHADKQDIVSSIVDATGLNPIAHLQKITRAVNEANRIIWSWIFEAYGGWQYDDANQTNLPSATTSLVASQQKYTILAEALTSLGFSVVDQGGNEYDLEPITLDEIRERGLSEQEFLNTPGNPKYYRMVGNVVKLYPAPSYSQNASLRARFDRGSVVFASTDSTKSPGFASEFHGAVSTGASLIIAEDKGLKNQNNIEQRWARYERAIKAFYKSKLAELNPETQRTTISDPASYCA